MTKRELKPWPAFRIAIDTPENVAKLLHESVVCGYVRWPMSDHIVIRRRSLDVPCGVEPIRINGECERRFAVVSLDPPSVVEVAVADVVPFVDVAKLIAEANERANAAQRGNVRDADDDWKRRHRKERP